MKSYVVILGGSKSHVPFINAVKKRGHCVAVVDRDTSSPGAILADEFFPSSTHDYDSIRKHCRELREKCKIIGIMTYSAYKQPLINVSRLCSEYRLASFSFESVLLAIDKSLMKKIFLDAGIPIPEYAVADNLNDALGFPRIHSGPCIIKPSLGSQGSAGVSVIKNNSEMERAFSVAQNISQDESVLIERYYRGREFSVEGFVVDRQPTVLAVLNKYNLGPEFNFTISGFSVGPILEEDQHFRDYKDEIQEIALSAVHAMGLNDSLFSVDVLLSKTGPLVLECGVFLDAKVDRLLYRSGYDIYDLLCRIVTKDEPFPDPPQIGRGWALKFLFTLEEGEFKIREQCGFSADGFDSERPVVEWERKNGEAVKPPESISDTVGWVIATGMDRDEAYSKAVAFSNQPLFSTSGDRK